jgi:putative ABC transport system permease protein
LRDLRGRWLQLLVIALVLGIGVGLFTGLGSMRTWRVQSQDASFALLRMHDLRMSLGEGGFAPEGSLAGLAASLESAEAIAAMEERLVVATQVDASRSGSTVLTPGRIVGAGATGSRLRVDALAIVRGRALVAGETAAALVEASYAERHDLPAAGTLRIAGGHRLTYAGQARSPEYFIVVGPTGTGFGAEESFGVLFTSLSTAQTAVGRAGVVNELVLRVRPGTDVATVEKELRARLAARLPNVGATFTGGIDEDAYRILYDDAANDQQMFDVFAILVLAGAALAAFNLVSRVVEAERRQIGIGMALGVPPSRLAIRPMALGTQIAVIGTALGVPLGLLAQGLLGSALKTLMPLPVLEMPFQWDVFARGAAIGLALPYLAAAYPVWRALRVTPIEAIRVGFRSAKSGGLTPLLRHVPIPGRSLAQMPLRNVLRTPRRTLTTTLGIAAVVTLVVAFAGMISSFAAPLERSERDTLRGNPERMVVDLAGYLPTRSSEVAAVTHAPEVAAAEPRLRVPGLLRHDGHEVETTIELLDPGSRLWAPRVVEGDFRPGAPGIVIAEKAARDLGVRVGDTIILRHPRLIGSTDVRIVESPVRVIALHANTLRFFTFMDDSASTLMGLRGLTNTIAAVPTADAGRAGLTRGLFGTPGVASIQAASAMTEALQREMDEFIGIIRVVELAALLLALLIAFNSTNIAVEERGREHATMFAFGLPVRAAIRLAVAEGLIVGLFGTALGIGAGALVVGWVINSLMSETFPELAATVSFDSEVLIAAAVVGVGAMLIAPVLSTRRLRRLDIPSALRVVE